jgi:hypothetical protein
LTLQRKEIWAHIPAWESSNVHPTHILVNTAKDRLRASLMKNDPQSRQLEWAGELERTASDKCHRCTKSSGGWCDLLMTKLSTK